MIPSTLICTCSDNWPFRKLNFMTFEISFTLLTLDLKTSKKLSHSLRSPSKTGNGTFGDLNAQCFSCLETPELACEMDLELCSCWLRRRSFSICLDKAECISNIVCIYKILIHCAIFSQHYVNVWISSSSCLVSGLSSKSFCWLVFNCSVSSSAFSALSALSKIGASFLPSLVNSYLSFWRQFLFLVSFLRHCELWIQLTWQVLNIQLHPVLSVRCHLLSLEKWSIPGFRHHFM